MKVYIGTKLVMAELCNAWKKFGKHKIGEEGYKVKYEDGYISWSPKKTFETHYHPAFNMTFGEAIAALEDHKKVQRTGWNGKGMWLTLVEPSDYEHQLPYISMKTVDDKMVPWLASQTDVLAKDWEIVD